MHAGAWYGGMLAGPGVVYPPPTSRRMTGVRPRRFRPVGDARKWSADDLHQLAAQLLEAAGRVSELAQPD